jgi:hypothetical protein
MINHSLKQLAAALLAQKTASAVFAETQALGMPVAQYAANYASGVNPSLVDSAPDTSYASLREAQIASLYSTSLGRVADAGGLAYWTNSTLTLAQIAANIQSSAETAVRAVSVDTQNKFGELVNQYLGQDSYIRAFAVGTNYVPYDMTAQIHEGEAIVPKAYNPAAGGQQSSARLERLVEGLTAEVKRLQAIVNDGNKSNERIASTLDNVTEGGANMRTVTT